MAVLLAALAALAVPFKVTFTAPTHAPKVNERWKYSVRAVDAGGKPLRARLSAQVVDPFGGVHPVEFGASTKNVVNIPFTGTFRDYVKWPPESKGFRLRFRVSVRSSGKVVRLTYWIRPR